MANQTTDRKAAEAMLFEVIEALLPGSDNKRIYEEIFEWMSDSDFDRWVTGLERQETYIALIAPELVGPQLNVARNLDVAEAWGHEFFQRVRMDPRNGGPSYLSNDKYLIVDGPIKRQAQFLIKKISIPEDNRSIDTLTGQPTGKSKGSKISWPEVQILNALGGFEETITEFIKYRGGDLQGFNAMNTMIANTGGVSIAAIGSLGTQVQAVQSFTTLLRAMHLQPTI